MESRGPSIFSGIKRFALVLKGAALGWIEHRAASRGAAIAYYTLFSMAPILVLVLAIAGFFYGDQAAQGELFNQLRRLMGPSSAQTVQQLLANAGHAAEGPIATVIATVVLLVGATSVFSELKDNLDEIWSTEEPPSERPGWLRALCTRAMSFGLILALALMLMASLVLSAALALLEHYVTWLWVDVRLILKPLAAVLTFGISASLFAVVYKMLPRVRLAWRDVWVGAIGTAALFALGKYGIGMYISHSSVASSFGAAGSLVALLLWLYYSAQIFLFGAEFTHHFATTFGSLSRSAARRHSPRAEPVPAQQGKQGPMDTR